MVEELRDREGRNINNSYLTGLKAIKKLKNNHNLEDTWRLKHPTKTFFTNHDKNYTRKSRIDRIYKSKDITMKSIQFLPF